MEHNEKLYEELRKRLPVFVYESFHYEMKADSMQIIFRFSMQDNDGKTAYIFTPELKIPFREFYDFDNLKPHDWDVLIFHCGMVESVSYWKAACCPTVKVMCGKLHPEQVSWWKQLYLNGLGEFFYRNGIHADEENFMTIEAEDGMFENACGVRTSQGVVVPVGGGKDSVVTLEILKNRMPGKVRPFIINPRGATLNCARQAGFKEEDCATVYRSIDPELLRLNAEGFLNGHTPFSAMLAFESLIISALTGYSRIALSNENSADESTVAGSEVNHQYSKSLHFENRFRAYVSKFISCDAFNYFSFLRPLSELGIARLFASYPTYHNVFRSCNAGSKTDSWCGACPKCLFAFIILAPFIGIEKCARLFGKNLLNDETLIPYLDELCGETEVKPFECVGTRNEVNWALQKLRPFAESHSLLRRYFSLERSKAIQPDSLLEDFSGEHNLPPVFSDALKERIEEVRGLQNRDGLVVNPLPPAVREKILPYLDTGAKPVAILGLGREGQSSYRLLRRLFPKRKLVLADKRKEALSGPLFTGDENLEFLTGDTYLYELSERVSEFGFILKTPGISLKDYPLLNVAENLSSQTDIFLKAYGSQIIGITGTKGKSTTTLLTHHLLSGYMPCVLAGNMGIPFFDVLDEITPESWMVCELSCHQLEHTHASPAISVLLNLYEEHLDHYGSFLDYQRAKMNLFGDGSGICLYNGGDALIGERLAERFGAKPNPAHFIPVRPDALEEFEIPQPCPLIGKHNELNMAMALRAAHAAGTEYDKLLSRIPSFKPLPHRLQYVGCVNGAHFFNDSISTVPQATIAAVESISALPYIKGIDSLILGGMDRGIDYGPLEDYLQKDKVKNITFVGEAGRRILKELRVRGYEPRASLTSDDYEEIVAWCKAHTRKDFACVLSPAAASYDAFRNFEHRGEVFMGKVRNMG